MFREYPTSWVLAEIQDHKELNILDTYFPSLLLPCTQGEECKLDSANQHQTSISHPGHKSTQAWGVHALSCWQRLQWPNLKTQLLEQTVTCGYGQRGYEQPSNEGSPDFGYILTVEFSSSAHGLDVGHANNQETNDESKVFGF